MTTPTANRACCTLKCISLPPSRKRLVVWKVADRYYCNVCFLNEIEADKFGVHERVIRLYEDEKLYEDLRVVKRPNAIRKRKPQQNQCGSPMQAGA